jgi:fructose-bisphosphate aldolase, class I
LEQEGIVGAVNLDALNLSTGKKARLYQLFFAHGPGQGLGMFLPVDQGLEHGPRDFFSNPDSQDPDFEMRLAEAGNFSAIVFQIGLAEKYVHPYAGRVPLVLKINGKTEIPSSDEALSPCIASVEDAVRLGASAVGYTLYVGSPRQTDDFVQFGKIRLEAERMGMPVIVWSYPRGRAIEEKGGQLSSYAIEYAARVAAELGADVVKINLPEFNAEKHARTPKEYSQRSFTEEEAVRRAVAAAGKIPVLVSGGSQVSDADVLHKAEMSIRCGAAGLIFGRNVWQRQWDDALRITNRIREMMLEYQSAAVPA